MQRTSAQPLALIYIGLVLYASLYPFGEWRDQGLAPWTFLWGPWPRYWTWFDITANVLGYVPLGFLLALSALRTGRGRHAVLLATTLCIALSALMETTQSYLPMRVPSNVDLALNAAGGWLGAMLAALLEQVGAVANWSRFRDRWFVQDARGGLVLLALWPVALLFPAQVPFGLGQVLERLELAMAELLQGTPFLDWLPVRDIELQPLVPLAELVCVALGLLMPCLLAYCIVRTIARRVLITLGLALAGAFFISLSSALTFGPDRALSWLQLPAQVGMVAGLGLAFLMVFTSPRVCAATLLLALGIYLGILNQAPAGPYFEQTLQNWEQGRFIRFHGLAQWVGWLWPYALVPYALRLVGSRNPQN